MVEEFGVPGYVLDRLLGFGGTGEVWAARPTAGGDPVALKRLRPLPGGVDVASCEEARQRLRREARILAEIDDPHVVRLHRLLRSSTGDDILVLDLAEGGSLAHLLSLRGRLPPGEVVTIAVPLAQTLAGVHRRGILHGDVSTANVLFAADGRPMLADLGVARLIGEPVGALDGTSGFTDPALLAGAPPRPASDVYGLAAVCWAALTGGAPDAAISATPIAAAAQLLRAAAPSTPQELAAAVTRALSADATVRPDAAEFSRLAWASAAAAPVRLPAGTASPASAPDDRDQPTRRVRQETAAAADDAAQRRRRAWLRRFVRPLHRPLLDRRLALRGMGLAAIPLILAGAAWAGTWWADATGLRAAAPAERAAPVTDWAAVLASLDERWSAAFAAGDLAGLGAVDAAGSPSLRGDRALLQRYVDAGVGAHGLRVERIRVAAVEVTDHRVLLDVVDRIPPYDLVDASGTVIRNDRGRDETSWRLTLVRTTGAGTNDAWRIASVARIATS